MIVKKVTKKATPLQDLMNLHKKYIRLEVERDRLKYDIEKQSITIQSQRKELMTLRGLMLSHIQEVQQDFKRPSLPWSVRLKRWWEHIHRTMNPKKGSLS